jgi:hypothetical protein
MRSQPLDTDCRPRLFALSLLWLAAGSFLLASTLVPAHTAWLGWTPLFWLFVAPLAVTLTLEPGWPRRLPGLRRPRRRARAQLIWN